MKKLLFVLILFLFFVRLKPVVACHNYDTSTGQCLDYLIGNVYDGRQVEQIQETIQAPYENIKETASTTTQFSSQFLTLAFQFFSIVILFIMLIILLEGVLESK